MKSLNQEQRTVAEYQRIEDDLRRRIRSGHWGVGAMLPSRRDLARQYSVSAATMERAVTPLIADGTIRSDDRRGTFVARIAESSAQPPLGGVRVNGSSEGNGSAARTSYDEVKSATVGVIALMHFHDEPYIVDQNRDWVRQIVRAMEESFSSDGKTTTFYNRVPGPGQPAIALTDAIASALQDRVNALAIVSFDLLPAQIDDALGALAGSTVPLVCVLAGELARPVPHVFYDNAGAGYQAAHHVINIGRSPVTVFAPFDAPWVRERLAGVRAAIDHVGAGAPVLDIRFDTQKAWHHDIDPVVAGKAATISALAEGWEPEGAIICVSDGVAFGVTEALADIGKKGGVDYAMVGFDDAPESRDRRLTSLRPPMEAMGREAARLLLLEMHGEPVSTQVRLRAHLIPRESTRFAPQRTVWPAALRRLSSN